MTDIHSHVLPAIDDGARNIEASLSMLRQAYTQGVRTLVATPHAVIHSEEDIDEFLHDRQLAYQTLTEAVSQESVPAPQLLLGAELYLDHDVSRHTGLKRLCLGASSCVLMEFPTEKDFPKHGEEWFYEMNYRGIVPVIAHIDRYPFWKDVLEALSSLRIYYQINASAFLTFSGRRLIHKLMKYGYPYIVSSDMHSVHARPCNMKAAYAIAEKSYKEQAIELFDTNAQEMLGVVV